jgi:hypothetical protein
MLTDDEGGVSNYESACARMRIIDPYSIWGKRGKRTKREETYQARRDRLQPAEASDPRNAA